MIFFAKKPVPTPRIRCRHAFPDHGSKGPRGFHVSIECATATKYQAGDQHDRLARNALKAPFERKMLEILVCPLTKGPLEFDRDESRN